MTMDYLKRIEENDRGPCPHPEGNICDHGIQWDLDCCEKCLHERLAKAEESVVRLARALDFIAKAFEPCDGEEYAWCPHCEATRTLAEVAGVSDE